MTTCLVALLAALAGCDLPGKPDPANKFVAPSKILDFAALYAKNCAACHGKDGKLGAAPPLNDSVFLAIVPEDVLISVITAGRAGTEMPAFAKDKGGTLTTEQVQALATGLRQHWSETASDKKDWPPYVLPEMKGDKERGLSVFARACAKCHGKDGLGTEKVGAINDPAFLDLASEQVLRRFVITGRPDLGMPNCAEGEGRPLSASEIDDLVALMMSWKQPRINKQ